MRTTFRKIRTHWTHSDTAVLCGNLLAFALLVGNCWWESLYIAFVAIGAPLAYQITLARAERGALRTAVIVGGVTALIWPLAEGSMGRIVGWWGMYLQTGPMLFDTPLYTVLIGWLGATYCVYVGLRTREMGFSNAAAVVMCGVSAFALGAIGENIYVGARMWIYSSARWHIFAVPAFVPASYAIAYGLQPLANRLHPMANGLVLIFMITFSFVALGLAAGFYPR